MGKCPDDEIGRHTGPRFLSREACGFKSHSGYHFLIIAETKMGSIQVVNIRQFSEKTVTDGICIRIFRPNILGNPFYMKDESERESVITKFHTYLQEEYRKRREVFNELMRLVDIIKSGQNLYLICFCAPKPCHGDIIAQAIRGIINHTV